MNRIGSAPVEFLVPGYADIPVLMDIEQDASALFAHTAHASEIDASGLPGSRFVAAIDQHLLWAARSADGDLVGFALVIWLECGVHLHEISVRARSTGQGIGSQLLEHVCSELAARGHSSLTLSTFSDVPWNAPFYGKHGFRFLERGHWSPALQAIHRAEKRHGLGVENRVFMQRMLTRAGDGVT